MLVDANENELNFECSRVEPDLIDDPLGRLDDTGSILQVLTGNVTIECESNDPTRNQTSVMVKVKAWRLQLDEEGVQFEAGIGFGQPFRISFWMPPEDPTFTISTDLAPEFIDMPESYEINFIELNDKTWNFKV